MATIQTNLISLFSQRSLTDAQGLLATSAERLSSGVRINRAKDDVAGLGISQELQRQIRSFGVSTRNAEDAISMVQTAEGALTSVSDMLLRVKELATQAIDGSLSKEQKAFIADEISQLRDEINAVAERTRFNDVSLLTGDFSQAVRGEFDTTTTLSPTVNVNRSTSTFEVGATSTDPNDINKSIVKLTGLNVAAAEAANFTLSSNGDYLTLSRPQGSGFESETIRLVSRAPTSRSEVQFNNIEGSTFDVQFSKFDISLTIQNIQVGATDRTGSELATKIASLGAVENLAYKGKGWQAVPGADWAVADTAGQTLKAIVVASEGLIRVDSSTVGALGKVKGENGVTDSLGTGYNGTWTSGTSSRIVFTGTQDDINTALASLQINSTTGLGQVSVEIVDSDISVYTRLVNGQLVTSYYREVNNGGNITWTTARSRADDTPYKGLTGYLANITDEAENEEITSKLTGQAWFGAYDAESDGNWQWADGPEGGTVFWNQDLSDPTTGPLGSLATGSTFHNWQNGEPNDSPNTGTDDGSEDYAHFLSSADAEGGLWNDYPNSGGVQKYIIEYGGAPGDFAQGTTKTIAIGTSGTIAVGKAIDTINVNAANADQGTYKLSVDAASQTATLRRYDLREESLVLSSETIDISPRPYAPSGYSQIFDFSESGVRVTLGSNRGEDNLTLGSLASGLGNEVTIATSRMASLIGENGPIFQTGVGSRNDIAINVFRDIRLGKNADSQNATLFNEVNDLVNRLDQASDPATADFQTLQNQVEDMITAIAEMRGDMGAVQNRLTAARNNIAEQFNNLSAAQSQILDTDFAAETARLTRMQIGQQASTAMLAQANQLPNVILALLQ